MTRKETTRVQLELPPASMERLKVLKERAEASSYAEVIKNALRLYEMMVEAAMSQQEILVRDKKGNIKELKIFF